MAGVTYSSYLKLDALLALQETGQEHDEMLFIVIHQVYELWFKQVLFELDYLCGRMREGDTARMLHVLRRVLTILKTMVSQLDILETMTPLEFLSFRDRLESGSGFQSFQFRELEFLLGYKRQQIMSHQPQGTAARERLEQRFLAPTLWDSFLHYLAQAGYPIPIAQLERDVTRPVMPDPALQQVLIDLYRRDPINVRVCERMIDLDEGIQEWRYRHVKMVQRTIGNKPGTGGSTGVKYLATTLSNALFPDLWEIRTEL